MGGEEIQGPTAAERIYGSAVRVFHAALAAQARQAGADSHEWTEEARAALEAARAGLSEPDTSPGEEDAAASEVLADWIVGSLTFAQPREATGYAGEEYPVDRQG